MEITVYLQKRTVLSRNSKVLVTLQEAEKFFHT